MSQIRQLAAIMFTDIVGYTALMGEDEEKAFGLLRLNREVQKPLVDRYHGKWIKELGDGVLASFQTVTDAVACAMKIQQACAPIDGLKLRIGIHLGEVVFENDDVFGDGVNIASRLQALAPVGGIYISESVFRNIDNQKDMQTEFVNEQLLKNVKHPVKIYQLKSEGGFAKGSFENFMTEKNQPDIKRGDKSIAVLPFVNMSNDPEQEYFSDGISEEIINSLVQLRELRVVGRTSSFSFKGKNDDLRTIGEKLGVSNILEGSVRKAGNRIRITAQLIEVSNGFHLWSQKFDKELVDIFDVQDEISKAIADQLMAELTKLDSPNTAKTTTKNIEAYNIFLKGRFHWSKRNAEGFKKSIQFYEQAVSIDPAYAAAYAAISDSYSLLCAYNILSPEESIPKARRAAEKAVAIDRKLAEGYEAIGHVDLLYDWDWKRAEANYAEAIRLSPAYATAHQRNALLFSIFDKQKEALQEILLAVEQEPLSLIINTDVAVIYFICRNYALAIEKCNAVLEIDSNFGVALFIMGLCYEQLNKMDEAIECLRKAWNISGNYIALGAIIHAAGKSGDLKTAVTLMDDLKRASDTHYISPYTLACAYIGLNEFDTALDFAETAIKTRAVWQVHLHIKFDPRMDPIRQNLRFQKGLAEMKFPG